MTQTRKQKEFKKQVLKQFKELQYRILPQNLKRVSDIDIVVRSILDLANKHIPELTSTINGLKEVSEIHVSEYDAFGMRSKYRKALPYIAQIIDHLEKNDLSPTQTQLEKPITSDRVSDMAFLVICFIIPVCFLVYLFKVNIDWQNLNLYSPLTWVHKDNFASTELLFLASDLLLLPLSGWIFYTHRGSFSIFFRKLFKGKK